MEMISVNSSNIVAIGWENNILRVQFNSGVMWEYYNVDDDVFQSFLNAESKGKFFHQHIKHEYEGKKIS